MATKEREEQTSNPVKGVVTARQCETCGHHEIVIITPEGEHIPLKPGMMVQVLSGCSDNS